MQCNLHAATSSVPPPASITCTNQPLHKLPKSPLFNASIHPTLTPCNLPLTSKQNNALPFFPGTTPPVLLRTNSSLLLCHVRPRPSNLPSATLTTQQCPNSRCCINKASPIFSVQQITSTTYLPYAASNKQKTKSFQHRATLPFILERASHILNRIHPPDPKSFIPLTWGSPYRPKLASVKLWCRIVAA